MSTNPMHFIMLLLPFFRSPGEKKLEFKVDTSLTIEEFKQVIEAETLIPHANQRLIYSGRVLKDPETIESYKVQDGHTIHLVKSASKSAGTSSSTSATGTPSNTQASSTNNNTNNGVPTNLATGTSASNPLDNLTTARYAGYGAQLPSLESLHEQISPEAVSRMMEDPATRQRIEQMMDYMLDDPQMLDQLIASNPMLSQMGPQVRQMLQNPLFRQAFTNPDMLNQVSQFNNMMRPSGSTDIGNASFPAPGGSTTNTQTNNANNTTRNTDSTPAGASGSASANPFASLMGSGSENPFASMMSGGQGAANPFFNPFLFGASGNSAAGSTPSQVDNRPPEERYETQLRQLNDMGFFDFDKNVAALRRSGGSVQGAIDALLNGSV